MSDRIDSPASSLAKSLTGKEKPPSLIILSGPSGSGKSTGCLLLAEQAKTSGLIIGGLISPPVFIENIKMGIDLVDQFSGEKRRLAVRRNGEEEGIKTTNWLIDQHALAWGNQKLVDLPPCDVVILDEIGPLELVEGGGLQAGLNLIDSRQVPLIIAVIRPKILPLAQKRWPWGDVVAVGSDVAIKSSK